MILRVIHATVVRARLRSRASMRSYRGGATGRVQVAPRALLRTSALALALLSVVASAAGTPGRLAAAPAQGLVGGSADSLQDPALTVGTLPNGMRYYLRANGMPRHRAELRLVVDAGSLLEDEDQQGFAHFLEHMAFNGTTHFPRNSLIDFIETSGMRFGADLNAYTSFDETVYMLTLPTDDEKILGQGLQVLRDWAGGGITIDSSEVIAERGVVMGEWRARLPDTASQTIRAHYDTLLFGDSRYASRKPIGLAKLLETAQAAPIRRFYHDWYRPDLMAVVVVGDFDPASMEREIRTRFGSIPAPAKRRPRVSQFLTSSAESTVDVYRGRVSPRVEVLWPARHQPSAPKAAVRQQLIDELLFQGLEHRLLQMRKEPSRPFITAQIEHGRIVRPIDVVGVALIAWPDSLERGLRAVLTEVERVAQHGVPAAKLARQKEILLAHLEHAAASSSARSSKAYANAYVDHYLTGDGPLLSAQQELALAREILPSITPQVLAQAAQFWRQPSGRRVLIGLPKFTHVRPPTRESILALFDSVAHTPLAPDSALPLAEGPLLEQLPTPGHIVREQRAPVAGITEWTLSNGARVLLKPTQNDPDELLLRAWSPGGFSLVPDSLFFSSGRMVARMMTEAAGLGTHSRDALAQQLATTGLRDLTADIGYANESLQLAGSPKELETLFQILYLQFTAPKLDTAALASWKSIAKYRGGGFSLDDQLNQIFARGNPRLLPISTHLAELATVQEAMAVYHNRFGNAGDFTFTIVGAVNPQEVRPLVERYLASLPSTGAHEQPDAPDVRPFLSKVDKIYRRLEMPKAQTLLVFDGPFASAPATYLLERQRLGVLTTVLRDRLRVRLREELAGTYSPYVSTRTYALPEERYRVLISFLAAPERMHELNGELRSILDSVRATGATSAELARAATIQRRQQETRLQDNDYWMEMIGLYSRLNIPLDKIPAPFGDHHVTPKELQQAAQQYLPNDVYLHLTAMPRDSTSYAAKDSTGTS